MLAQLGNRVQHALRAYTPGRRQGAQGDGVDLPALRRTTWKKLLTQLGTGRGDHHGAVGEGRADPGRVDPAAGPESLMAAVDPAAMQADRSTSSPLTPKYAAGDRPRVGVREAAGQARSPGAAGGRGAGRPAGGGDATGPPAQGGAEHGRAGLGSSATKSFLRAAATAAGGGSRGRSSAPRSAAGAEAIHVGLRPPSSGAQDAGTKCSAPAGEDGGSEGAGPSERSEDQLAQRPSRRRTSPTTSLISRIRSSIAQTEVAQPDHRAADHQPHDRDDPARSSRCPAAAAARSSPTPRRAERPPRAPCRTSCMIRPAPDAARSGGAAASRRPRAAATYETALPNIRPAATVDGGQDREQPQLYADPQRRPPGC